MTFRLKVGKGRRIYSNGWTWSFPIVISRRNFTHRFSWVGHSPPDLKQVLSAFPLSPPKKEGIGGQANKAHAQAMELYEAGEYLFGDIREQVKTLQMSRNILLALIQDTREQASEVFNEARQKGAPVVSTLYMKRYQRLMAVVAMLEATVKIIDGEEITDDEQESIVSYIRG